MTMVMLTCCGILTAGHYFNDPQFSKTGQIPEAPAGIFSKHIQCYTATISNKNEVKEI